MTVIADTAAGGSAGKGPGPEPESGAVVEAAAPADSPPGRADDDRKVEATPLPGPAAAFAASAAARKADHGAAEPGPGPGRSLAGRLSAAWEALERPLARGAEGDGGEGGAGGGGGAGAPSAGLGDLLGRTFGALARDHGPLAAALAQQGLFDRWAAAKLPGAALRAVLLALRWEPRFLAAASRWLGRLRGEARARAARRVVDLCTAQAEFAWRAVAELGRGGYAPDLERGVLARAGRLRVGECPPELAQDAVLAVGGALAAAVGAVAWGELDAAGAADLDGLAKLVADLDDAAAWAEDHVRAGRELEAALARYAERFFQRLMDPGAAFGVPMEACAAILNLRGKLRGRLAGLPPIVAAARREELLTFSPAASLFGPNLYAFSKAKCRGADPASLVADAQRGVLDPEAVLDHVVEHAPAAAVPDALLDAIEGRAPGPSDPARCVQLGRLFARLCDDPAADAATLERWYLAVLRALKAAEPAHRRLLWQLLLGHECFRGVRAFPGRRAAPPARARRELTAVSNRMVGGGAPDADGAAGSLTWEIQLLALEAPRWALAKLLQDAAQHPGQREALLRVLGGDLAALCALPGPAEGGTHLEAAVRDLWRAPEVDLALAAGRNGLRAVLSALLGGGFLAVEALMRIFAASSGGSPDRQLKPNSLNGVLVKFTVLRDAVAAVAALGPGRLAEVVDVFAAFLAERDATPSSAEAARAVAMAHEGLDAYMAQLTAEPAGTGDRLETVFRGKPWHVQLNLAALVAGCGADFRGRFHARLWRTAFPDGVEDAGLVRVLLTACAYVPAACLAFDGVAAGGKAGGGVRLGTGSPQAEFVSALALRLRRRGRDETMALVWDALLVAAPGMLPAELDRLFRVGLPAVLSLVSAGPDPAAASFGTVLEQVGLGAAELRAAFAHVPVRPERAARANAWLAVLDGLYRRLLDEGARDAASPLAGVWAEACQAYTAGLSGLLRPMVAYFAVRRSFQLVASGLRSERLENCAISQLACLKPPEAAGPFGERLVASLLLVLGADAPRTLGGSPAHELLMTALDSAREAGRDDSDLAAALRREEQREDAAAASGSPARSADKAAESGPGPAGGGRAGAAAGGAAGRAPPVHARGVAGAAGRGGGVDAGGRRLGLCLPGGGGHLEPMRQ